MDKDEKLLWELFCNTGEPRYYSMYLRARDIIKPSENEKK